MTLVEELNADRVRQGLPPMEWLRLGQVSRYVGPRRPGKVITIPADGVVFYDQGTLCLRHCSRWERLTRWLRGRGPFAA